MNFLFNLGLVIALIVFLAIWVYLPWMVVLALVVVFALWMALTRRGRQAASVTAVGVSTLRQRLGSSSVVIIGIAGVVGVLVALLAMGEGYAETLRKTGSADTAIVMRGGSASEVMSVMDHDSIVVVPQAPGIARDNQGKPVASPEIVVAANLPIKGSTPDDEGSVQLRGVSDQAWAVRPNLKIIAGRKFTPGMRELIVGQGAQRQFAGLEPGHEVKLGNQTWTVVGVFASNDALDSEIWGDADTVASTYRRGSSRASVTVKLADAKAYDGFKAALAADPRLKVDVDTTLNYFSKQSEGMSKVMRVMGITVGLIMAIGAVFGALNTMFAAVASRAREIATLRAIGFPRCAGRGGNHAGNDVTGFDRRLAWRIIRVADLQWLYRVHHGSRDGWAADFRFQSIAGVALARFEMGASDWFRWRIVSCSPRCTIAGHHGIA